MLQETVSLKREVKGDFNDTISANSSDSEAVLQRSKRIVGGDRADIREFPWVVSITANDKPVVFCGGSIISPNIVLTAAHCFFYKGKQRRRRSYLVRAGSTQREYGGSEHRVLETRPHEGFIPGAPHFSVIDVGLMYVTPRFEFDVYRRKIALPKQNYVETPWSVADIAGWGSILKRAPLTSDLRSVQLTISSPEYCASGYPDEYKHLANLRIDLCTHTPGKSICSGDSGSPLTAHGVQLGISSQGSCDSMGLAVFMKVSTYRDWIDTNSNNMTTRHELRHYIHDELRKKVRTR